MGMSTTEAPAAPSTVPAYRVRVLCPDSKRPWFLSGDGQLTRLKIRTVPMAQDKAERLSKEINDQNPGITASPVRWKSADGLFNALSKWKKADPAPEQK